MHEAAIAITRHVHYRNAGTIEFLVDLDTERFYFIEMNTRIQVEHPVTEILTGIDLVREQLSIADGNALSTAQDLLTVRGHAIECRINAEDPTQSFLPAPGTVETFVAPQGADIRVDTHCFAGSTVPPFYDSLLAKVIVSAADREQAIDRMRAALSQFKIGGVPTTVLFHLSLLADPVFRNNEHSIRWAEESMQDSTA